MKKITGVLVVLLFIGGMAFSQNAVNSSNLQNGYNVQVLKKLGFTDSEIKGLIKIQEDNQRIIINARAELDIYKAELKKLLLSPDVNMKDVEKLLRKSMDWELKLRLAQIRQQVESRKLVGEKKWIKLVRYTQRLREKRLTTVQNRQNKKNPKGDNLKRDERVKKLLKELEQLLNEQKR
ncbi:MAG: hypothetical protein DRP57_04965 [Spirochaetes bacterium]|nr:MAG: hypothetical protein DRP57_04965 [Spirochaetota bacterium]